MTPIERIGELVANALTGQCNGRALQQAIGEHLEIPPHFVSIEWRIDSDGGTRLEIEVPR